MASVVLPTFVTFKGDNERFLCSRDTELHFDGDDYMGLEGVHEVIRIGNNQARFRCVGNERFWEVNFDGSNNVLMVRNSIVTSSDQRNSFTITHLGSNVVALRAAISNQFCKRFQFLYWARWRHQCRAVDPTLSPYSRLTLGEPVNARELGSIVYHLDRATVYGRRTLLLASKTATNNTQSMADVELEVSFTSSRTSTFSNSVTVGASITMKFTAGLPLIGEAGFEISVSSEYTREWGETTSEESSISSRFVIKDVKPGSSVTMTVTGAEAKCDVPFSYTQRDTWINGDVRSQNRTDGIFQGLNVFDIRHEAQDQLSGRSLPVEKLS